MAERRIIRNSTAEFLIFQIENKEQGIEVMYAEKTIWCTQKAMAALFDVGVPAISKHLANVFESGELKEEATISKMETVQNKSRPPFMSGDWYIDIVLSVFFTTLLFIVNALKSA